MAISKHAAKNDAVGMCTPLPTEAARDLQAEALRRVCGPRRATSLDDVERSTGIARRTLESYRDGEKLAPWPNLLAIAEATGSDGPVLLNHLLGAHGLGGVERLEPGHQHPATVIAALVGEARELAVALEDGVWCHADKAAAAKRLAELGKELQEAAAAYAAPLRSVGGRDG